MNTKETIEEYKHRIEIMQALEDGKVILRRAANTDCTWLCINPACEGDGHWHWELWEYKIKPEPREFYIHLNEVGGGCVTNLKSRAKYIHGHEIIETIKVREVL